jgi:hypothetical protein
MKKLLITGCTDRNMWYSGLVGQEVPFLREESDAFMSREPAGFVNFVRKADGHLVEDDVQPVGLLNWAKGQKAIGTKDLKSALGRLSVHVETNFLGFPVVIDPTMPPHQARLVNPLAEAKVYRSAREWAEAHRNLSVKDAEPIEWVHPDRAAALGSFEEYRLRRLGFLDKGTNDQ